MTDRDFAYHVQDIDYANPIGPTEALIRVRVRARDVSSVSVVVAGSEDPQPMRRCQHVGHWDFYEAPIHVPPQGISYCFVLDGHRWFTKYGTYDERAAAHGWWSLVFSDEDIFRTPDWVHESVFYQIFPERFCNGDRTNDPPHVRPWDSKPGVWDFFGGDLQGVLDRLDYLQSLGINAIYFNPIFKASTNHKYNTADYYQIDPHFGDLDLFKRLVAACHARGIRVILDGVFNHVGVDFGPFQDVVKKGKASQYVDWFYIKSFPVKTKPKPTYVCWWDIWELPKLNTQNPVVRKYLIDVAIYWIKETGIDGWRLDVPEEVPHSFWAEFRTAVKAVRPDAYIVGEIWHDGRPWLRGDQFDAVMNYRFREAALNLLGARTRDNEPEVKAAGDVKIYDARIHDILSDLPVQVVRDQFNLLGSHDTARVLTLMNGDRRKVRLAALLMFTAPGAPVIYYGDEVGMAGDKDPDCRRGFPWDEAHQDRATLETFKSLIALRHAHAALRTGRYATLQAKADVYAFAREGDDETILTVVNASAQRREVDVEVSADGPLTPLWGGQGLEVVNGHLRGTLEPFEGWVGARLHPH